MYQGQCLCGAVQFMINGPIRNIVYCYCSECRKAQGSASATNGIVEADNFTLLEGDAQLSCYPVSPQQGKYFCRHCGSPIMSRNTAFPDQIRVRLGTITSDITERPMAHIFVTSKASWDEIPNDGLPRYEGHEPGRNEST